MIAAGIILAILIVGGGLIYLLDGRGGRRKESGAEQEMPSGESGARVDTAEGDNEVCCGMHITCEKDSLSTAASTEIVYYEDEELDAYVGRSGEDYTAMETEQFRDILLTLLPEDIAGWARSLQLRHIALPPEVSDELLLIVREAREKSTK